MFGLAKYAAAPWFLYLKIALVAVLAAGAAWVAWKVRGSYAEREKTEAVNAAVQSINEQLRIEQQTRAVWEGIATGNQTEIIDRLKLISGATGQIRKDIAKERAINPEFYGQKLPEGGYNQWMKARALVVSPAASAVSAP